MLASFPRDGGGPREAPAPDFDPAVVDEIDAAGIYVRSMNVHALMSRERFGEALEKVIMGLYSGPSPR